MNPAFMNKIQEIRDEIGVPLPISSAYRCPEHNERVSKTGRNGPHTTGKAVDIAVSGPVALAVVGLALEKGIGGIGVSQKGPHKQRFIHLDVIEPSSRSPRPTIWSY